MVNTIFFCISESIFSSSKSYGLHDLNGRQHHRKDIHYYGARIASKACIPTLLQVMIDINNVKKVLGITRVIGLLGGKVAVIH